jgi:hypothetical protein
MLGGLGAALIVFAVVHVVMVASLAGRPHGGPAFAVLTAVCGAGGGCAGCLAGAGAGACRGGGG